MANDEQPRAVRVRRIYEPQQESDGFRILIDRLWPRGLKKSDVHVDVWLKEVAPSTELRKWFDHDPTKWPEFLADYSFELNKSKAVNELMRYLDTHKIVTLLYAAKDETYNNGVALKLFIDKHFPSR